MKNLLIIAALWYLINTNNQVQNEPKHKKKVIIEDSLFDKTIQVGSKSVRLSLSGISGNRFSLNIIIGNIPRTFLIDLSQLGSQINRPVVDSDILLAYGIAKTGEFTVELSSRQYNMIGSVQVNLTTKVITETLKSIH